MKHQEILSTETGLNKVKSSFEEWRSAKDKGRRIPQFLWEEAVALYPEFTIGKIATTLSLSYADLKKRVDKKVENRCSNQSDSVPAFIELDFSAPSLAASECVVEMEDGRGSRMRMCFRGKTDFDLLELGKSFWMRQS